VLALPHSVDGFATRRDCRRKCQILNRQGAAVNFPSQRDSTFKGCADALDWGDLHPRSEDLREVLHRSEAARVSCDRPQLALRCGPRLGLINGLRRILFCHYDVGNANALRVEMMPTSKQRSEQHLIDQEGEKLLRSKLPRPWVVHEYRPDYGLDFSIEVFKPSDGARSKRSMYATLGEHFFLQLKSVENAKVRPLAIYSRRNVEKETERVDRSDKVTDLDTYCVQIETTELVTVERMGIGVPVLLVIADLSARRCSFVCLNDYIDKILIPRHEDYRGRDSRAIHVPVRNEIGTDYGHSAMRWYAKRPKLLAAFQRFTFQDAELRWARDADWRGLAEFFAKKISAYDFWDDTEMCFLIPYLGAALRRFVATGQPGLIEVSKTVDESITKFLESAEFRAHTEESDVFELWRRLALLPRNYEDVWREWFLPTALGHLAFAP